MKGKFQNKVAQTDCKDCPIGYQSNSANAKCFQCNTGKYTDTPGQTPCKICPWRGECQHLIIIHPKTRIAVSGNWHNRIAHIGTRFALQNILQENGEDAVQTGGKLYDRQSSIINTYNNSNVRSCQSTTDKNIRENECRDIHWFSGSEKSVDDVETNRRHVSSRDIFFEAYDCPTENKIYDEKTCKLGGGTPGYAITNMGFFNPYHRLFYKCEQFADDQIYEPGPYKQDTKRAIDIKKTTLAQLLINKCNHSRTSETVVPCNTGTSWEISACEWGKRLRQKSNIIHKCYNREKEVCRKKQFYKSANYYRSENICDQKPNASECKAAAVELGLQFTNQTGGEEPNGCIMHNDNHVTYNVDNSERIQTDFCTYKTGKECICKSDRLDRLNCAAATGLPVADLTNAGEYVPYYRSGEMCLPSDSFDNAQECKVATEWLKTNPNITFTGLTDIVGSLNTDNINNGLSNSSKPSGCFLQGQIFYWNSQKSYEVQTTGCGRGGCVCKRNELPKGCSIYNSKAYWSDSSNEKSDSKYTKIDIIPESNFKIDNETWESSKRRACFENNSGGFKFGFNGSHFTRKCLS